MLGVGCGGTGVARSEATKLLHVSYDPTRELFADINPMFQAEWRRRAGRDVEIAQSHGGSGKQARYVIEGLKADVVTLALGYDVDAIAEHSGRLPRDWQSRLPNRSTPFGSTIAFAVRRGNPKRIRDWDDLIRPGVSVITPNPKTSGAARWNYLAAWGFALQRARGPLGIDPVPAGDVAAEAERDAYSFVSALIRNVPVLDAGARGATTTFARRGLGDVLINWENEVLLLAKNDKKGEFEVVVPPTSIAAEPPAALVDRNADRKGTREVAVAYLEFLFSEEAQAVAATHFFRPYLGHVLRQYEAMFRPVRLFSLPSIAGDWARAQAKHFADDGLFDRMVAER